MDTSDIAKIVQNGILNKVFPGAVVGVLEERKTTVLPFGTLNNDPKLPVTQDTLYDVASITKSLVTNSITLLLIDQGKLSLQDKAVTYLPELGNQYREDITIHHLLTYSVVLDKPKPLSEDAKLGAEEVLKTVFTSPLKAPPGQLYWYTNTPAIMLGIIIERIYGKKLDEVADELFFKPLGMKRTTFHPEEYPKSEIAPSEIDWRGEIWGKTNDESAWALNSSGMMAGSAGLFSTAADVLKFAKMILDKGKLGDKQLFSPEMVVKMRTSQLPKVTDSAGLGWEIAWPNFLPASLAGKVVGKTGFTGCLILMDAQRDIAMVLLANRNYPRRQDPKAINKVRHDLIASIFA